MRSVEEKKDIFQCLSNTSRRILFVVQFFFYLQDSSSTLSLKAYGVKGLLGLEVSREAAKSNKGTRYIRHLYYYLFCAWPTFIYLQLGDVQCQLAQLIFICHGDP